MSIPKNPFSLVYVIFIKIYPTGTVKFLVCLDIFICSDDDFLFLIKNRKMKFCILCATNRKNIKGHK